MNFESLVGHINHVQDALQAQAAHAVNLSLTARNWLVGYYIVEYEQHGEDRAKYGEKLINRLAKEIDRKGFEPRRLREFRQIYIVYPQLGSSIASYLQKNNQELTVFGVLPFWQTASAKLEEWATPPDRLFYRLIFSSLLYIAGLENPLKRAFYEQEAFRRIYL